MKALLESKLCQNLFNISMKLDTLGHLFLYKSFIKAMRIYRK